MDRENEEWQSVLHVSKFITPSSKREIRDCHPPRRQGRIFIPQENKAGFSSPKKARQDFHPPRIQGRTFVPQEYKAGLSSPKKTRQDFRPPRIQGRTFVPQENKAGFSSPKKTRQDFRPPRIQGRTFVPQENKSTSKCRIVQKPTPQTLGGALQKDANCKCLVLTLLIYGCLAAIVWCRCTNVTKVAISFAKYPFRSTKQVSPCEDGYVYIPIAFMGMLYLVYLVECYHSSTRIELKHARSQHSVFEKLTDLKLAQPTVWWKAISYHYVRRQRHITRYRNGDNYTTTQVYYDRINSHTATSFYFYGHCGWKDITKSLVPYQKIPITKIMLSKSFAFSNVRSATEFEEARSRFFAEQVLIPYA